MEIALPYRGNAWGVVYAVQLGDDIWVVRALQKKSTQGIKTPKHEMEMVKDRLKRLKDLLRCKRKRSKSSAIAAMSFGTSNYPMPTSCS